MPLHLIPHLSPSHRHTTLLLYRALLHQVSHLAPTLRPPPSQPHANPKHLIKNLIHNRFHSARHIVSPHLLRPRFLLAYEALDHLDAAVAGDAKIFQEINDLLARCTLTSTRAPRPRLDAKTHKARKVARRAASFPLPLAPAWTARPLPLEKIKGGRRKVPVLFTANHIPVLRFGKPQPASLSGYLMARVRQRQRRQDLLAKLTDAVKVARMEDEWEGRLQEVTGLQFSGEREREASWTSALTEEVKVVKAKLGRERKVNRDVGRAMQEVVDREGELAEREKGETPILESQRPALPKTEQDGSTGRRLTENSTASSAANDGIAEETNYRPLAGG